ncbi:calmodulin, partial [Zopfochytrium polystomum]
SQQYAEIRTCCRFFDLGEGGGSLEIRQVCKNLGEGITDDEVDEILKDAKIDVDGQVYYNDFVELLVGHPNCAFSQ